MRKLLLTAAAVSAAAPALRAQITFYDIPDQTITGPGGAIFLDFDNGGYGFTSGAVPGFDHKIYFSSWRDGEEVQAVGSPWQAARDAYYLAARYTFGAEMSFSRDASRSYLQRIYTYEDNVYKYGNWANDTGTTTYLGSRNYLDNREAWIAIEYDDAANTLKVLSFAVAPGSANMTAGAVPEPAETAVFMAMLAGGAAVYHRRRRLRQAA